MAEFHPNQPDGKHKCEHCGALYIVSWASTKPASHADTQDCQCCHKQMADWSALKYPIFTLHGDCPGKGS